MTNDGWITIAVVLAIFIALVRNLAPADIVFITGAAVLALVGVISPTEAFSGFSNPGVLTVAVLFVVAAGLRETGVIDAVGRQMLGTAKTEKGVLARLATVIIPSSAFLNNTPIVAMFVPVVLDWSRRHEIAPSKLLIPLSYLAILGGTCTLIGTSTNLVVHGLMLTSGNESLTGGLGLFEIGAVGLPYAVVGVIYLLTIGPKLLPQRKELLEQLGDSRREYLVDMLVQPGCRLIGKTVDAAGLRNLPGLFLIEIDRNGTVIAPAGPEEVLQANDRLVFTGVISSVVELQQISGFIPAADPAYEVSPKEQAKRRMCEVVISTNSPLIGKTIREADIRAAYGAAVVAVHRGGSRIPKKVGDIRLRPGDTLLLQTPPHFVRAHRNTSAFFLVSDVDDYRPLRRHRAWVAIPLFITLIVLLSTGWVEGLIAAALVAAAMVIFGCISAGEARRSVEWQLIVTIAGAFGIGMALQNSGAAATIAQQVVLGTKMLGPGWGPFAALACIYISAAILTELITNNAVAVLIFPICLQTAELYDKDPRPFVIALVLAASASLMTPIGYQTNLLVYGPGGYRFTDFFRVGAPLSLLLCCIAMLLIPQIWPL
jgi:di/tricarboxylate transporter